MSSLPNISFSPCRDKPAITQSHIRTVFRAFYCFTQSKLCPFYMGREELEDDGLTSFWVLTAPKLCRAEWG